MSGTANERAGAAPAPDGLDLVQELLNTVSFDRRNPTADLIADGAAASDWAAGPAAARGLPALVIDDAGAERLRMLRSAVAAAIRSRDGRPSGPTEVVEQAGDVTLVLGSDGRVVLEPGAGDAVIAGLVLAEILRAQARGDWDRLKLCAFEPCSLAFYDRSRNRSGRYHAVRCQNWVNLRASRDRRATRAES
jgi:predicted RNA-binding Zn ribbon-like protein